MSEEFSKHQLLIFMHAIDNYIRRKNYKKRHIRKSYPILIALAKILMKDVIDAIDNHICPYCKAEMKTRFATIRHIVINHGDEYYNDIKYVVEVYARLRKKLTIVHRYKKGSWIRVLRLKVGDRIIEGRQRDIAKEILKDPNILQELGVL